MNYGAEISLSNLLSFRAEVPSDEVIQTISSFYERAGFYQNSPPKTIASMTHGARAQGNSFIIDIEVLIPLLGTIVGSEDGLQRKQQIHIVNALQHSTESASDIELVLSEMQHEIEQNRLHPITPFITVQETITDSAGVSRAITSIYIGINPNRI